MKRRFRTHQLRALQDLGGLWDFAFLGERDPEDCDPATLETDDIMPVPGCFDATPRYAGLRGLAVYSRELTLPETAWHRFVLSGVHHWCRVFLLSGAGATTLGEHVGGFTTFHMDAAGVPAGPARLVVLVDNRFDTERCPLHLEYFDWYHYGGIAGGVELHCLPLTFIESVRLTTSDWRRGTVEARIRINTDGPGRTGLTLLVDGRTQLEEELETPGGPSEVIRTLTLPEAARWSPEEPNLHTLQVRLGDDDLIERFGIRQVETAGREIRINGEPVRLLGFCRHESHPQFGSAVPAGVQVSDVQMLEDLGCNFVRGSHYPQDPRFLDLCDERGLCVWSESIGWQHTEEHLTDRRFLDAQLTNIREMIAVSANHPSVLLWGILNESHSHVEACRPAYEELLGEIRSLDPSRPVTYASNHLPYDQFLDLVDIVSVNTYPGWYVGQIEDIPKLLDAYFERLEQPDGRDKPLIISEIGAGAVPGWRDQNRTRWSEEYQVRLLETVIEHLFVNSDRTAGLSLWQFCDCRVSQLTDRIMRRPRGFNNKGIVDEYRRPKLAYDTVKTLFSRLRSS